MNELYLDDPGCPIARYILNTHWVGLGHRVLWCLDRADGAGFELSLRDVYPLAGRVVDHELCAQRINFMVAVGWLPDDGFQLVEGPSGVPFVAEHDFAAKSSQSWAVPERVLPLDKVALALAATSVQTGRDEIDLLAVQPTSSDWETFELYSLQVLLDVSRRAPAVGFDPDYHPFGVGGGVRQAIGGPSSYLDLAERAAQLRQESAGPIQRRWWSRK